MSARICIDCAGPVSRFSKGRCKACSGRRLQADPVVIANRAAAIQAYMSRPEAKEQSRRNLANYMANMPAADRAARSAHGARQVELYLQTPEGRDRARAPEARRRAEQSRHATLYGWCPPELLGRFHELVRAKRIPAAEARRMIEAEIPGTPEHARREIASRQLAARLRHERQQREAY